MTRTLRNSSLTSLLVTCTIAASAHAQQPALEFESTNFPNGSARVYGQFNPAYQYVDDGFGGISNLVDNAASTSRLGLWINQDFGDNRLRFNFETGLGVRPSDGTTRGDAGDFIDWQRTDIRKLEFIWSAGYGEIYLGQGSMATDGVAEFDASGTTLVTKSSVKDFAGDFQFRDSAGGFSGVTIGDAFTNLDGSRRFRIRYDTPDLNGFEFRVAYGQEVLREGDDSDYYDAGIVYAGNFGETEVEAGLGYAIRERPGSSNSEQLVGSVSVLLGNGLNFALASGAQQTGNSGDYAYAKIGYIANFLDIGATSFSVDYNSSSDFAAVGTSGESYGIGVVQKFDNLNLEGYLGYNLYSYEDGSTTAYEDISALLIGARWRF